MELTVVLALSLLQVATAQVTIATVSPAVGPVQGGSVVYVTGTGFVGTGNNQSRCAFTDTDTYQGGSLSPTYTALNSTLLQCEVPRAAYLMDSSVNGGFMNITGGFRVDLTVVGELHSNPISFLYFDTSTMLITMVTPQEGLNSTNNNITVTGRGFVPSDSIVCRVDSSEGPCTFLSPTSLSCTLPSHPLPSTQTVDITVSGDALGLVPVAGSSTDFTFYSSAPQLAQTHFSPSYAQLIVIFDREVEIGGEAEPNAATPPLCTTVFVSATLQLLGNNSTCEWLNLQQRAVLVSIYGDSTVAVGDSIHLRANVFRTRRVQYSRLSQQQSVRVGHPPGEPPFYPIAIVTGPSAVPGCGEVELSGAYSRNTGPHPLEYLWTVSIINTTNQSLAVPDVIAMENISSLLPLNFTLAPVLTLPTSAFQPGYEYLFALRVRNFLNLISDPAYITVVSMDLAPAILQVVGGKRRLVNPQDGVLVEVDILLVTCSESSDDELSFMWELRDVTSDNVTDVTHLVDVTTLLTPVLWIPSLSLLPGHTYEAVIIATSGRVPGEEVAQETITLESSYPSIAVSFVGGTHQIVSVDSTLLLDITGSYSFQYYSLMGALRVEWECARVPPAGAPEAACSSALTGDLLRLPAQARFTLDGSHLGVGTFRFTVIINNTLADSVTMATVEYEVGPANNVRGVVRITEVARGRPYAISTDEVVLNGLVQTPEEGVVYWESTYLPGLAYLRLSPASLSSPITYPVLSENMLFDTITSEDQRNLLASANTWQPVSMVIKRGMLLPGQTYQFRLIYTVAMVTVAMAEVNVSVVAVPSSGTLSVSVSSGVGNSCLSVTLSASGWTDYPPFLPLSFQFGYTVSNAVGMQELDDTTVNWFGPPSASQSLHVALLPPNATSAQMVLRVCNTQGGSVQVLSPVTLFPPPNDPACSPVAALDKIARDLVSSKDYRRAITDLVGVVPLVTPTLGGSDRQGDIAAAVLSVVYDIHDRGLPRTQPFLVPTLQVLREVARWNLSGNQTQSLFSLTASILGYLADLAQPRSALSVPGATAAVGALVADVFAALLLPSDRTALNRVLSSSVVDEFFASALPSLGHALCTQQGVGEQAPLLAAAERRFLLKATLTTPPGIYLTSDAVAMDTVSVMWGESLRRMYHAGGTWEECYLHGNTAPSTRCGGVCLASLQYPVDLHWQGQPYAAILRTTPVALLLLNQSDGSVLEVEGLAEGVSIAFPLVYGQGSPRGSLTCVHWDPLARRWSDRGCSTVAMTGTVVCTCNHLTDFAVLEICDSGFYGNDCSLVCPEGRWGSECAELCACSGRGTCHASSGACNCTSGYMGALCEAECPAPFWGYQCKQICLCVNGGTCHHANGMCICPPGWVGPLCNDSCTDGFYGVGCQQQCTCRLPSQCLKDTGKCVCDVGYTGQSCTQICPEGSFGAGCAERCACHAAGTLSCNHINGSCICAATWSGVMCAEPTDPPEPPFWAAGIAVVVLLLVAVVITILVIILVCRKRLHKKKALQRVEPSGEGSGEAVQLLKQDLPPGTPGSNEDELNFTHTSSLTVIIPKGARINDMFASSSSTAAGGGSTVDNSFREPEEINGKVRWQVVHVYRNASGGESPTEDGSAIDQKVYPRGVYLPDSASLKDLRSAFISSNQLEEGERMFVFLVAMEMEETYAVDDESVFTLKDFEATMTEPHTFYITSVELDDELMKDLCVCGRVSEYVCGRCESQGYCTEVCQEEHWTGHHDACKRVRRQRRQERKERRRLSSLATSPPTLGAADMCVCGAPAEFECSACGNRSYCSSKCQVAHWAVHKEECGKD